MRELLEESSFMKKPCVILYAFAEDALVGHLGTHDEQRALLGRLGRPSGTNLGRAETIAARYHRTHLARGE